MVAQCVIFKESNRLKYRSGSGSGSRNLFFDGSVSVQVQDFSKLWVQVRFRFTEKKRFFFRFAVRVWFDSLLAYQVGMTCPDLFHIKF